MLRSSLFVSNPYDGGMSSVPLQKAVPFDMSVAGVTVRFDWSGALFLPESGTLVFSDLHFEKGTSYGRRGIFLPPYDTRRTLSMMAEAIGRFRPLTVISLGDAFHDRSAEARMNEKDALTLEGLMQGRRWVWILGNHDPEPPARFAGEVYEETETGGLLFGHEPCASGAWQVAGHMHPAAKVNHGGRSVRRRCFMTDGERLILPSFGAYTGGLNVLDAAYRPFFASGFDVHLLGQGRTFQVPRRSLKPDSQTAVFRG